MTVYSGNSAGLKLSTFVSQNSVCKYCGIIGLQYMAKRVIRQAQAEDGAIAALRASHRAPYSLGGLRNTEYERRCAPTAAK
jgi:hypothetical protein